MTSDIADPTRKLELPQTIDLMKLASALERGGSRRVGGTLRSAWRAQSCVADLEQSQGICNALDNLEALSSALDPQALWQVRSGLLASAIMLYVRATSTAGSRKERGSIQLDTEKLRREQREDHEILIRLRNSAVGHVETSVNVGGYFWHRNFLFAKAVDSGGWQLASASTNIGFLFDTFERLKRQLPVAIALISEKADEWLKTAVEVLDSLKPDEVTLKRYEVDPLEYFGSLEVAILALSGKAGDHESAWLPVR